MKFLSGLIAGALLTLAVPVCAQSLGDIAKKEAERRKALPPAAKTYTNEDLKRLPPSPRRSQHRADQGGGRGEAGARQAGETAETAKDARTGEGREATGAGGSPSAKEEVRRNEMFRDALQSRDQRADRGLLGPRRSVPAREDRRRSAEGARRADRV